MLILLITHIIIALSGLTVAAVSLFNLSEKAIKISYVLTGGTLATGTLLVLQTGNVLKSCLTGLAYLAAVLALTALAKYRLSLEKTK